MTIVVNTNVASLIAQRNLNKNTSGLNRSFERLASGLRINRAGDDAAGLNISEILQSDIRGMKKALQNSQDGISILQITEGALSVIGENLQRVRELTVQAANDTNSAQQRNAIELEISNILQDNQRIVAATEFNAVPLIDGSVGSVRLQVGAKSSLLQNTLDISSVLATTTATAVGLLGATTSAGFQTIASVDFTNGSVARAFLSDLDVAIVNISNRRSQIGAFQNQLDSVIDNLQLSIENFSSSLSRIRDLNIAEETAEMTKNQILQQSSISILTQANQAPSILLSLLG